MNHEVSGRQEPIKWSLVASFLQRSSIPRQKVAIRSCFTESGADIAARQVARELWRWWVSDFTTVRFLSPPC